MALDWDLILSIISVAIEFLSFLVIGLGIFYFSRNEERKENDYSAKRNPMALIGITTKLFETNGKKILMISFTIQNVGIRTFKCLVKQFKIDPVVIEEGTNDDSESTLRFNGEKKFQLTFTDNIKYSYLKNKIGIKFNKKLKLEFSKEPISRDPKKRDNKFSEEHGIIFADPESTKIFHTEGIHRLESSEEENYVFYDQKEREMMFAHYFHANCSRTFHLPVSVSGNGLCKIKIVIGSITVKREKHKIGNIDIDRNDLRRLSKDEKTKYKNFIFNNNELKLKYDKLIFFANEHITKI